MKISFGKKSGILIFCLCLVAAGFWLAADKKDAHGQEGNTVQNEQSLDATIRDYTKSATCEGNVVVKMGGLSFNLPKDRKISLLLISGKSLQRLDHPWQEYTCDTDSIEGVKAITWLDMFSISNSDRPFSKTEITYTRFYEKIKQAKEFGNIEHLPMGLSKIRLPGYELYLLPKEHAPTSNGDPVVLDCLGHLEDIINSDISTKFCSTAYMHPSGLRMSYHFFRKGVAETEYILGAP